METKSRYEALADLETQKRSLMNSKYALKLKLKEKAKIIKLRERELIDLEDDLVEAKEEMTSAEAHFDGLILAVEKGIEVFTAQLTLNSQKK